MKCSTVFKLVAWFHMALCVLNLGVGNFWLSGICAVIGTTYLVLAAIIRGEEER